MGKKKIALSLDGGGARGLFSLNILLLLKKCLNVELCETFSLVVGASVGALVGALIAFKLLDEDFEKILEKVLQMGKDLFTGDKDMIKGLTKPIYSGKNKRNTLKKIFGDTLRLGDACLPFVVLCTHVNGTPRMLKSWNYDDGNVLLLDALDASSAAPLYFPPVQIQGEFLVDGGCTINNPTAVTAMLMRECYHQIRLHFKILSIGTHGVVKQKELTQTEADNMGLMDWISRDLIGLLMGSNDTSAVHIAESLLGPKNVLRIKCQVNTSFDTFNEQTISVLIKETIKVWTEKEQDLLEFVLPIDPYDTTELTRTVSGECLAITTLLKSRASVSAADIDG
jgi:patatin-like phospholipase/acyl hydrolase